MSEGNFRTPQEQEGVYDDNRPSSMFVRSSKNRLIVRAAPGKNFVPPLLGVQPLTEGALALHTIRAGLAANEDVEDRIEKWLDEVEEVRAQGCSGETCAHFLY
ncbi:hypothetical protein LTR22_023589 [Elasticomyces elasticus]|nr:hypothetical protein LTR22_023589 [Elasticomyces elasticus]KAK4928862.1 hypothetical protein LTR49_004363 [Elasticomyces elasticus]KAK5765472.1 hypothetical protein LTS12_004485 [Elasticomyces elasticus]